MCAVGGAHQPVAGEVKKLVGLEVHFHRHVRAAVQIGVNLASAAPPFCKTVASHNNRA
ncbi:hypothetical protein BLL52_2068 [Rhodoferax antarcticus ANT.BR]|uniref:Uncharacterized protein n=1 Tax=Rhodoferax antarcticus ANT.BR TaxID=1111071 RepID=A0A1Q8YDD0_9BURK|nr:hypothetical protein BLL52_2068 [Rhodoferax antarcticus ANT.BR]